MAEPETVKREAASDILLCYQMLHFALISVVAAAINQTHWEPLLQKYDKQLLATCSETDSACWDRYYHSLEAHQYALLQLRRQAPALADLQKMRQACPSTSDCKYVDWLYRMYARQQMTQTNVDVDFFDDELVPDIAAAASPEDRKYVAYSQSAAMVARTARLCEKNHFNATYIAALEKKVNAQFKQLLTRVTEPYFYNLVLVDAYQTSGILGFSRGDISVATTSFFMNAAEFEVQNLPTEGSPEFPVIPALETFSRYLEATGADVESEKLLGLCNARWGPRTPPTMLFTSA